MSDLQGKTLFITGASRGIGREIALRAARDGANVVVAAKTTDPHPKLPGTIHSVAREVEEAGGKALAVVMDVRNDEQIEAAVALAAAHFGGIDILVNNASAISLTGTVQTEMKRVDLMFGVNVRGTYACSRACIPWLLRADNPHILNLAPPLNMSSKWFAGHVAYTMAKYGMSMCVLGMAEEFRQDGIAVNALWPRTVIYTAALAMIPGVQKNQCRTPAIVADAAHAVFCSDARTCTGNFFIDEQVLANAGMGDLDGYLAESGGELLQDLFLDP